MPTNLQWQKADEGFPGVGVAEGREGTLGVPDRFIILVVVVMVSSVHTCVKACQIV